MKTISLILKNRRRKKKNDCQTRPKLILIKHSIIHPQGAKATSKAFQKSNSKQPGNPSQQ